tara:strand:+ start:378 stop:1022 length:645 start_codon:yes stop_codon:yes gene_type:complete
MFKFHDVEQNTDEWFDLRSGRITGSAMSKAMANYGKAFGEPAKKYAVNIAIEQITGKSISSEQYNNEHMDRGHEEEPIARMLYEEEYFCEVTNGGFFDCGDIGCSPDGMVNDDGLIEIKSAIPSMHYSRIAKQSYDSAYKWQIIGNLKLTERDWIDFISYCSWFPEGRRLYVHRSYKEDFVEEFNMIDIRIGEFRDLIKSTKEIILNNNYSITG